MFFDSKWVAVARHGLILWENGAMGLRIILKYLLDPGPRNLFFYIKFVEHNFRDFTPRSNLAKLIPRTVKIGEINIKNLAISKFG